MSRDVGVGDLTQETTDALRDLTSAPITSERLQAWAAGSGERQDFLSGACWGQIEWDTALGRPHESSLAAGFAVRHSQWVPKFVSGGGTWVDESHWEAVDDVASWDLPADGGRLRVGFMFRRTGFGDKVAVAFAGSGRWEATGLVLGPRAIEPPQWEIRAGDSGFVEFEVVEPVRRTSKTKP